MIAIGALIVLGGFLFVKTQYRRCPSNKILVVYGKVGGGKTAKCIHGGGTFVIPMIQESKYLPLDPVAMDIKLQDALSAENIRVNVPSTFTIGISTKPAVMQNAAERLLGLTGTQIVDQASDIIFGQLRQVIASMTIEEINRERDKFQELIRNNVGEELQKIGLELINVNIRDITDSAGYIEAIGRKAASEAVNRANIDVADQDKLGAVGVATADRQKNVSVAEQQSQSEIGQKAALTQQEVELANYEAQAAEGRAEADKKRRIAVAERQATAIEGENTSKALVAKSNATLQEEQARSKEQGEVALANAEKAVFNAEKAKEIARLEKEEVAQVEIQKQKITLEAQAEAERLRETARGEADAIFSRLKAEADGEKAILDAKADGYRNLVDACGDQASNLLLIEILPKLVEEQAKAFNNIKFDKITVFDGNSGNGKGGTTSNFINSLIGTMPIMHQIAANGGLKLPEYLGSLDGEGAQKIIDNMNDFDKGNFKENQPPEGSEDIL